MKLNLLEKTNRILNAICSSSEPMTLKELSAKLEMPVPTLSRICNDLAEIRWLEKTDYHHFTTGLALIRFGDRSARLSPYSAAVDVLIRDYARKTGLNGMLTGYYEDEFFTILRCAQSSSDADIFRRSGVETALLNAAGVRHETAKNILLQRYPDFSDVEMNTFDREYEKLNFRKLLLRVGIMRQWYVTVPFMRGEAGYALTFYGSGQKNANVETVCNEVEQLAGRVISAWNRISRQ